MDAHTDDILAAVRKAAQESCSAEELSLLLIDTTTSYQKSEYDDDERKQILADWQAYWNGEGEEPTLPPPQTLNDPPLRKRGHSNDHRPREPQVKIGLVTTEQGRVVDVQTHAGNTSDQSMTIDLLSAAAARLPGHRLVAVMDSGMGGGPNLAAIDTMKPAMDRVSAIPLRRSTDGDARVGAANRAHTQGRSAGRRPTPRNPSPARSNPLLAASRRVR